MTNENMTKEVFMAYEEVRMSGMTNMFDVKNVMVLADGKLSREDIMDIMKNYGEYSKRWL